MSYALIGAALFALGSVLLLVAVFADRAGRGHMRRRCPKCWFDLSGTPGLTCPECGHAAAGEGSLFRSRVRRRWAVLGVVLLVAGGVVVRGQTWDWFGMLPTWAKVEFWAYTDDPQGAFERTYREVWVAPTERRRRRLMDMALRYLVETPPPAAAVTGWAVISVPERVDETVPARRVVDILRAYHRDWPLSESARRDLLKLLTKPELGYQVQAVEAVVWRDDLDAELIDGLKKVIETGGPGRMAAVLGLSRFVPDNQWARDALAQVIRGGGGGGGGGGSGELVQFATMSLLHDGKGHADELVKVFESAGPEARRAMMAQAAGWSPEEDVVVLYPLIMEEAITGQAMTAESALVALERGGAGVDVLVVERVATVRGSAGGGEPFKRLLAVINARRPRNGETVVAALEAAAADESRSVVERRELIRAARRARQERGLLERWRGR